MHGLATCVVWWWVQPLVGGHQSNHAPREVAIHGNSTIRHVQDGRRRERECAWRWRFTTAFSMPCGDCARAWRCFVLPALRLYISRS